MTMDSNMDNFFQSLGAENDSLTVQVSSLEAEIFRLTQQFTDVEKALEKQKKFHRKYAEDVVVTEKLRIQDFKEEKRSLIEQNTLLIKENRQLTIDSTFYKKAYEELANEVEPASISQSNLRTASNSSFSASVPAATSVTDAVNSSKCSHKSSKVLSKISEKLLLENKKLKVKLENLNATIRILKSKNQKLENFKKKIDTKKMKFSQDSDELAKLVESTKTKNETTFNHEVLAKLGELSEYKVE